MTSLITIKSVKVINNVMEPRVKVLYLRSPGTTLSCTPCTLLVLRLLGSSWTVKVRKHSSPQSPVQSSACAGDWLRSTLQLSETGPAGNRPAEKNLAAGATKETWMVSA